MKDKKGQILFGALANQIRCQILRELEPGEKCVNDLVHELGIKQSLVSHNLKILIKAGLVRVRRSGTFRYYSANRFMVNSVFRLLGQWENDRSGAAVPGGNGNDIRTDAGRSALFFFKLDKDGIVQLSQGSGFEETGFVPGADVGKHYSYQLKDMPNVLAAVEDGLRGQMIHKYVTGRGFIFGLRTLPLLDKDGRPNGCIGVVYDIRDRLEMKWQLAAAESRWRSLFASIPSRAALIDVKGRIILVNQSPSHVPMDRVIGMSIFDWFSKAQRGQVEQAIRFVVETNEANSMILTSSGEMDGTPTAYRAVLSPVQNNGDKAKELVVVFRKYNEQAHGEGL